VARLSHAPGNASPATWQEAARAVSEVLRRLVAPGDAAALRPAAAARGGADLKVAVPTACAGLVLLHPYLRMLFGRLDMPIADGPLPERAWPRALAILHALTATSGPQEPIHHALLGLRDRPALVAPPLEPAAEQLVDGLLSAVVGHWGQLGKTSPGGLRHTFLLRPGMLRAEGDGTHLEVASGPFDMLLDGLPWPLTPVALPWMPLPCHVTWRTRDA
jgi:hypothetical protein